MSKARQQQDNDRDIVAEAIAADRGVSSASLFDEDGQLPRDLVIEWPSVAWIKREPDNPRDNVDAVPDVVQSLSTFGWQQPIVVDANGNIIVGDTRFLAALQLKQTNVPVYVARRLSQELADAYRLADNKTGERARWDVPKLNVWFDRLESRGLNLELTGFRIPEIERLRATNESPESFPSVSEDMPTEHKCPKCGYEWSGKS